MHKALIYIILLFATQIGFAQDLSNIKTKSLFLCNDTIALDSLSIVPGSEIIFYNTKIITPNEYKIDYPNAQVIFNTSDSMRNKQVKITYRVFPISFTKRTYLRNIDSTIITGPVLAMPENYYQNNTNTFFTDNQLSKQGSISRGITVGNNQDAVINSNLNIQLAGKLNDKMNILAAISDDNIPIQPDGNSQQIQDFDKVFIQVYNEKTKIIAGDFEISKPNGYFLNLNKKAQGGLINTRFNSKKNEHLSLSTTISGAISKGKYCRKNFQGTEGNQGPYKLTGCENEQFIIILAGTERVYINGKLKKRGQEYDYVIDYNTGEISFTANEPITKDSRIAIEFEYSERSYSRYFIYSENTITSKKGKFWINVFSEQDNKNQPINQDLSNEHKELLYNAGDQTQNAFIENVDSIGFKNDFVLYEKLDTNVSGINYNIYNYSINPAKAIYQVGFSFVGENKGNYIQTQSSANGKVFKWIAPVNNVPQGSYEPVRLLIAPKKMQIVNLGGNFEINSSTKTFFEIALSNNDLNTFSPIDESDNFGYGIKLDVEKDFLKDSLVKQLTSVFSYQLIDKNFTSPEKFRNIEFERDWNLQNSLSGNEHLAELDLKYRFKSNVYSNYGFSYLEKTGNFEGNKHRLNLNLNKSGYKIVFNSSLLDTKSKEYNTQFIRYLARASKSFNIVSLGIENELERNEWIQNNDSLSLNSFYFSSYKFYVENSDSSSNQYMASYTLRNDYLPYNNQLSHASKAEDFSLGFALLKNPKSILRSRINYRMLNITDTSIINQTNENSITGRIDYTFRIFKGAISSSTFYEAGSGLEPKREFSYLKVTSGQGVYAWTDYNGNNVAELDEFEIAKFQDQANYIRIYTPGTEYIKTYSNEFSQVLNFRPNNIWRTKTGLKKLMSQFSNNLAYSVKQKSNNDDYSQSLNPFYVSQNDSSTINLNQNLRNTFSYNHPGNKFGVDYIFQQNSSRILLSNGFDDRQRKLNSIVINWNLFAGFFIQNNFEFGLKSYNSQFFSAKNYEIENRFNEIKLKYQPGFQAKAEINYAYNHKTNILFNEEANIHKIGSEINYSFKRKGNILIQLNYFNMSYNADENTALAYEMLEGLKSGNNSTWSVIFQRKLGANLELNLNYSGRVSEGISAIHTGSLQVRAFF